MSRIRRRTFVHLNIFLLKSENKAAMKHQIKLTFPVLVMIEFALIVSRTCNKRHTVNLDIMNSVKTAQKYIYFFQLFRGLTGTICASCVPTIWVSICHVLNFEQSKIVIKYLHFQPGIKKLKHFVTRTELTLINNSGLMKFG